MGLYLINAATDAKRQARLGMTEAMRTGAVRRLSVSLALVIPAKAGISLFKEDCLTAVLFFYCGEFAMITPARVKSIYKTWQLVALVEFGSKEQDLKALKTVAINTAPFFIFRTMFVIKQKVLQVFRNVKARDLVMKIIFTLTFVLYCFFLYTCFNPVAGDFYPIYENISPSKPCELEGKRLFLERDGQDSSFLYDFFIGYGPQFYDTEPEDGFVIDSSSFSDRIVIKKSPTTNNIIHSTKAVNDCRCYIRWYN